jgi:hypothetical protein
MSSAWGGKVLPLLPGDIKTENLGGGFYQLDFPVITQVAGLVTTNHEVPFPHKIAALYVKHTDSAGVDESTDTLTFSAKFGLRPGVDAFSMAAFNLSTNPDEAFSFTGDEAVRNACRYEFKTTDVDAGNLVYVTMMVRALGEI